MDLPVWIFLINGVIRLAAFCVWLFLLIVMVLTFIHDVRCVASSPFTVYIAMNIPLRIALAASHGFCMTVFIIICIKIF